MTEIVLSGMRPTGALHLGHYVGVIKNWLELQKNYNCYFFVADWHALTTCSEDLKIVRDARIEYVRGWLACGVDPKRAKIYNQSSIKEILYLSQFFLAMTPPGWADRSPSWKDHQEKQDKIKDNLGFYTYPILQAADIAIVRSTLVPVGEDQDAHIEIAREIIRKFNRTYGSSLPEPKALHSKVPKLMGLDGGKMSSSIGNVITLRETEKSLQKKLNKLKTDELRNGISAPGNPENCYVYEYHKVFASQADCQEINNSCRSAQLGCGDCKAKLGEIMKRELMPIAERMEKISDQEALDVLEAGTKVVSHEISEYWNSLSKLIQFS